MVEETSLSPCKPTYYNQYFTVNTYCSFDLLCSVVDELLSMTGAESHDVDGMAEREGALHALSKKSPKGSRRSTY